MLASNISNGQIVLCHNEWVAQHDFETKLNTPLAEQYELIRREIILKITN